MKRKHRHSLLIQQWLDDDSLVVERKVTGDSNWYEQSGCYWNEENEYRFKPKMIKCGDLEFPEPMRVAPKVGTDYYLADPTVSTAYYELVWEGGYADTTHLNHGLAHADAEAAQAHGRALIALTEVK